MAKGTKRNHTVPRYYLTGFTCVGSDTRLYQFERNKGNPVVITVGNAGARKDFYTLERPDGTRDRNTIESWLSQEVESPANRVIDKIRAFQPIDQSEKEALAKYMAVMLTRGVRHRERVQRSAPKVAADMREELDRELDQAAKALDADEEFVNARRELIHQILDSAAANPPDNVRMPMNLAQVEAAFGKMEWRFLHRDGRPCFLTGDNPVFTDYGAGLAHHGTEVFFPISTAVLLWATWYEKIPEEYWSCSRRHQNQPRGFWRCPQSMVKVANDLAARNATRFVWAWTRQGWITNLLLRPRVNEPKEENP